MGGNKKSNKWYRKVSSIVLVTSILSMDITTLIGYTVDIDETPGIGVEVNSEDVEVDETVLKEDDGTGYTEDGEDTNEGKQESAKESGHVEIVEEEPGIKPEDDSPEEPVKEEVNAEEIPNKGVEKAQEDVEIQRPQMQSTNMKVQSTNNYVMAKDSDFSGTTNGNFRYIGTNEYVEIPHTIKGVNVTSYESMFEETSVKGVKSTNKKVTNMSNMFRKSNSLSMDVSQLDTSAVTTMSYMFAGVDGGQNKIKEITGLENFDTSKVRDMAGMFSTSDVTKLDLSSFDTSNVTTMMGMFYVCQATEIKGLENFNTTKVTTMGSMFASSRTTRLDLSSFNTGNVVNMSVMFMNSFATEIVGLEGFNTAKVDTMSRMFEQTRTTVLDLSSFSTQNVVTMNGMFRSALAQEIDISNFNTGKVRDMGEMFSGTVATTINLGDMDTRNVTSMAGMFQGSRAKVIDVRSFDTTKVTSMKDMFYSADAEAILISEGFKTHNTTKMSYMFASTNAKELDLTSFDTTNVTMMDSMFSGAKAGSIKGLTNFNTSNVVDMGNMFNGSKATKLDVSKFNTQKVENMLNMFKNTSAEALDLSSFDTSKITDMGSLFEGSKAKRIDVSSFTTSNVYNMRNMFKDTHAEELDLSSFDMSSVNDTTGMFSGTKTTHGLAKSKDDASVLNKSSGKPTKLEFKPKYEVATDEDFSGTLNGYFRYTGDAEFVEIPHVIKGVNVNNYTSMFAGTAVRGVVSTNPKVTNMSYMFDGNTSTNLDVRGLNTSNVSHFEGMFKSTKMPKLDLSTFDTRKVVNTSRMFENAKIQELDLGSFDLTNTYKLDNMFKGVNATKGYARTTEDAKKLNNSLNKPTGINFTVRGLTTEQENTEWTNESVKIKVNYNNDHYEIDYMELLNGEGRNLITGSHFDNGAGELVASSSDAVVKDSVYKLTPKGNNIDYTYTDMRKNLVPGETYTLSLKHRNNVPVQFRGGVNVSGYDGVIQPTDEWKVSHVTFKVAKSDVIMRLYFYFGYGLSTSNLEIDWIKLERGDKPTPWSVAPEDDEVINNTKEYQVPVNGTYVFRATDKVGNTKTVTHTVTNIDTVKPTAELTKSTEGWTSQDVTIYVDAKDDLSGVEKIVQPDGTTVNGATSEYKATKNGKYTFKVYDKAGNMETYTTEVTNIDRSVPKLNASIDNTNWTRDPVNIKVTSEESASGLKDITMKSSPIEGRNLLSNSDINITANKDSAFGRNSNISFVGGLDLHKTLYGKPTTLSYFRNSTGGREKNPNVADWGVNRFGIHGTIRWGDSKGLLGNITEYTNFEKLEDVTDNERVVEHHLPKHETRDKLLGYSFSVQPYAKPSKDNNDTWVMKDVKFEVGGKATPWTPAPEDIPLRNNSKTYPVVANGLYTFESTYNNGTTSEVSVNVTNIDLEKPEITVQDNPEDWVESDEVVLKVKAKDTLSGVSKIILPDGKEVAGDTATYKVTKNGDYTFKVVDKVGNEVTHTETVKYLMVPYNFYIYDKEGNPARNVEFELLRDGEQYKKAVSNTSGLVDFGYIPPEGKYSIRQITSPGGVVVDPEDVETPDVTEPIEVIHYPRGRELPGTGTEFTLVFVGLTSVLGMMIAYIHKIKRKER